MHPNKQSYMLNDSMNIEKHIKTYLLNTCIITENAKLGEKAQENKTQQASMSTDPTPTTIIYSYNKANEYFQKNFIGNPFG
jgi:DNA mismatch repair ATPase MutL